MFFLLSVLDALSQGDLLVTPTRIVFEKNERNKELILVNTGSDTATYLISWVHYRADENGKYHKIEEPVPGQYFASEFLRFFPKKFSLAPNDPQTLRMQLRRSASMIDGEYISHLYFRAVPKKAIQSPNSLFALEQKDVSQTFTVEIIPIYGVTIPVIVQQGEVYAEARFADTSVDKPNRSVDFKIVRTGNISINGSIQLFYRNAAGNKLLLKEVNSVTIFSPNKSRLFHLSFAEFANLDLEAGSLELEFKSRKPGEKISYAAQSIPLP